MHFKISYTLNWYKDNFACVLECKVKVIYDSKETQLVNIVSIDKCLLINFITVFISYFCMIIFVTLLTTYHSHSIYGEYYRLSPHPISWSSWSLKAIAKQFKKSWCLNTLFFLFSFGVTHGCVQEFIFVGFFFPGITPGRVQSTIGGAKDWTQIKRCNKAL